MTTRHSRTRCILRTLAANVTIVALAACGAPLASVQPAAHAGRPDTVAQWALWRPKPSQAQAFEAGYAQHLQWHAHNGDTWNWYGWYVVSGPRQGLFIDATFDHAWADFDRAVMPEEDRRDNARNVEPFADFQLSYRVSVLPELSIGDTRGLTSRFTKLVTVTVTDDASAVRVLERLRAQYQRTLGVEHLLVSRVVDGGSLGQVQLLIGTGSNDAYGRTATLLEDLREIERALGVRAFGEMTAERLAYLPGLSLVHE